MSEPVITLHRQDGSELTELAFRGWPVLFESDGRPLEHRTISTERVGAVTYALRGGPDENGAYHYYAI